MNLDKVSVLGVSFDNKTKETFLKELIERIRHNKKTFVVTANPEIVMYAKKNADYMSLLNEADYIAADGIGIIKGAKILETPIVERVAGFDLLTNLLEKASQQGSRVYFLGAKEDVLQSAVQNVQKKYPSIQIVGSRNGYFDFSDSSIIEAVQATQPDMVFVALGFPKQEQWIHQYMTTASKGLLMGVGGSFDVLSGKSKRAPKLFIDLNIEWLYRLIKQPTRLKRMMVLPQFLLEVKREKKKQQR
ncbi:WecB/TagA/CpsF family glycosyltransferase [Carnobacterium inhibens]|uniref:N-acetylglucosaminyldiphosphoundecaprenol N-acetyl-beta-D-mannosaminyltransferase n=1 Tax=Carnobacterium inhibens TaxID=147709 RepID=A0ABR7TD29_9LACT|nr:WecB/TagA/CpsF family glycosyltransferase [Carnobacterium inhibens]MBC9825890.1 WecB/TagA/CpsF family glycosyltransferase [Carnobacterium inhibens]